MKILLLGYCIIILFGMAMLLLPFATRLGAFTSPLDAFFTATSATCVTGLVRFDTFAHWTLFGQIVILCLIQIGGLGFMTLAVSLVSLTKRKIGLYQRVVMQESVSAPQVGGIVRMTKFIFLGTLFFEAIGALLLSFYFCPAIGFFKGLYFSIFHSVSAFCNAGFDLMGSVQEFSSLTTLSGNWYVNIILMALIIIGGLGFFVWLDILDSKCRFNRMKLQTKLVIIVSASLIILGAVAIYIFELRGTVYNDRSTGDKILMSLFQSVTSRTAGFDSANVPLMTQQSQFMIICLMLVGGSTGSTAGGIKTTTFAVLVMSVISTFRKKKSVELMGRRIDEEILRKSSCILIMYLILSVGCAMVVSWLDGIPLLSSLFETVSAIATVGLSSGISESLGAVSQILLALLMIFGRVGSITFLYAFASEKAAPINKMPLEKIRVG